MLRLRVPGISSGLLRLQKRLGSGRFKVVSAEDAVHLIRNGSTITVAGFVTQGAPEEVLAALGERYRRTGEPKNLTLVFEGGPGDYATKGLNHLAQPGLLKRVVGALYGQVPMIAEMARRNQIEAYSLPLGCISRMLRCAANGQPGHVTTVGMGTFVDPANGGGKINDRAMSEDLVVPVEILGKKYLLFKAIPIDVALIRGTTADPDGNITFEQESLYSDNLIQAMSARPRRGLVIAQVERIGAAGTLHPRKVIVPGTMVDAVVKAENPAETHRMGYLTNYDPAATGEVRSPPSLELMPLNERKVIARRAALEMLPGQILSLGLGMPEAVAFVAHEEKMLNEVELMTEAGVHGGVGLQGFGNFGPAVNYDALLHINHQFDFYNGGGLDACFLGMAQVDATGNVNVTTVGERLVGSGGFVDISCGTKRVHLLGTFTADGLQTNIANGKISISNEGKVKKFVSNVQEISLNGTKAIAMGQAVQYITERCVFRLTKNGIELTEIAPGIDLQKDILDQMEFKPLVREPLALMDAAIFTDAPMNVRAKRIAAMLTSRAHYSKQENTVWFDLGNLQITTPEEMDEVFTIATNFWSQFEQQRLGEGNKAHVVVNYDGFDITDGLISKWKERVAAIAAVHYLSVRRYTKRAFTRHKLASDFHIAEGSYDLAAIEQLCRQRGLAASDYEIRDVFNELDVEKNGVLDEARCHSLFQRLQSLTSTRNGV